MKLHMFHHDLNLNIQLLVNITLDLLHLVHNLCHIYKLMFHYFVKNSYHDHHKLLLHRYIQLFFLNILSHLGF